MEHADALRRAQPLVGVRRPVRGGEPAEVDVHHARRMRRVDQGVDASAVELADDGVDGEHERGRRRHVADEREARLRRDGLEVGLDGVAGLLDRERDADEAEDRAVALGRRAEGVDRGVVLVVAGEQLVAGLEPAGREDGRDAHRRVRDEREALGIGAQEPGDLVADLVEARHQLAVEEPDGLGLHAFAPDLLGLEDGRRGRAERPVVEERDAGFEQPGRAVVRGVRHPWTIADPAGRVARPGSADPRVSRWGPPLPVPRPARARGLRRARGGRARGRRPPTSHRVAR